MRLEHALNGRITIRCFRVVQSARHHILKGIAFRKGIASLFSSALRTRSARSRQTNNLSQWLVLAIAETTCSGWVTAHTLLAVTALAGSSLCRTCLVSICRAILRMRCAICSQSRCRIVRTVVCRFCFTRCASLGSCATITGSICTSVSRWVHCIVLFIHHFFAFYRHQWRYYHLAHQTNPLHPSPSSPGQLRPVYL